jgi:tRNA (cytidine/uridine-2'-O-)-methyltransferase
VRLALYQPDIPQNLGACLRIGACWGVAVDVIEPCGFLLTDRSLARAAMDYAGKAVVRRHSGFEAFLDSAERRSGRLVLIETDGATRLTGFAFAPSDVLMLGRESAGTPQGVYTAVDAVVRIPMAPGLRSLNVAVAGAVALAEAMRQTGAFDGFP